MSSEWRDVGAYIDMLDAQWRRYPDGRIGAYLRKQ